MYDLSDRKSATESVRVPQKLPVKLAVFSGLILVGVSALSADIEAGKTKVAQQCAECHRLADWNGETQAALESLIKDILAGKVQHNKRAFKLSDQDAANIAAYWTSGRK